VRNLRTKKGEDPAIRELEALSLLKEYGELKNEMLGKYNKKTEAKLEKRKCGNVLTEIRNRVKLRERLRKVVTGRF
jgi:hypothetical protein